MVLCKDRLIVLIRNLVRVYVGLESGEEVIFDFAEVLQIVELPHKLHESVTFLMELKVSEAIGDSTGLVEDVDTLVVLEQSRVLVDLRLDRKNDFPEADV